ncbi:hypothetical protein MMC13_000962 [Lambiella insularis]|nr:hypothetical protein [Lambiella insularis]
MPPNAPNDPYPPATTPPSSAPSASTWPSFDVTHAHQVLQHVRDPAQALREMRRVTKPGGVVAAREADFAAMAWWPDVREVAAWQELYVKVARWEPNAGRQAHVWARRAGFSREKVVCSAGTWCYRSEEDVHWWSGLWAERVVKSGFAEAAVKEGLVTTEELEELAEGWRRWGAEEDAWFAIMHGEMLCWV